MAPMRNKNTLIWLIIAVLVIAGVVWLIRTPGKPGKLDSFASCVADAGAVFYGTFWCSFCQNQKAMFGSSAKNLPYVECSTPDGRTQLPVCLEAGIEGYPTWDLPDGTRETGVLSLERLSEVTACPLPESAS